LKKLAVDESALLKLLNRWREEAEQAGHRIKRIAVAFEAGRDGFWLARWLRARVIEAHVIHASSVAVSREHRRAKTDRLDTELLKESVRCSGGTPPNLQSAPASLRRRRKSCRLRESPAHAGQPEMVRAMRGRLAGDGDAEAVGDGEIGQRLAARIVALGEVNLFVLSVQGASSCDATLEGSADAVWKNLRADFILEVLEDRHRHHARDLQHLHPGPDSVNGSGRVRHVRGCRF
jgi:hypothetical protein